jgi:hypothetical protein
MATILCMPILIWIVEHQAVHPRLLHGLRPGMVRHRIDRYLLTLSMEILIILLLLYGSNLIICIFRGVLLHRYLGGVL